MKLNYNDGQPEIQLTGEWLTAWRVSKRSFSMDKLIMIERYGKVIPIVFVCENTGKIILHINLEKSQNKVSYLWHNKFFNDTLNDIILTPDNITSFDSYTMTELLIGNRNFSATCVVHEKLYKTVDDIYGQYIYRTVREN